MPSAFISADTEIPSFRAATFKSGGFDVPNAFLSTSTVIPNLSAAALRSGE